MFQTHTDSTNQTVMIFRTSDSTWIPSNPMNVDYLQYVAWLFDGNTPEEWNPEVTQPDMEEGN
jgi:hypothetical protein